MECWQLGVHKAMLSMSSGYPGELSPGCGIDSTRLEMSRRGQERSTTQAQDRLIVLQARHHWFCNATTLRNDFQNATGVRTSTQTVRNLLHDAGLRSRGLEQFTSHWHHTIVKNICNGRRLMLHGPLMTGPKFSSLMSPGFVLTS